MKTKKAKQVTLVNFILDASGSMSSTKQSTINSFNEYINSLKNSNCDYKFTLTLFNSLVEKKYVGVDIKAVKDLDEESYFPMNMTALYDAVCSTILSVKEKKDQKVITVIMTDGEENSSKEYTQVQMKALIQEREKKGNWSFVYLGANQDSYAVAQTYGIPTMNVSNYSQTEAGTKCMMASLATNTASFSTSDTASTSNFFSAADQFSNENVTTDMKISNHFSSLGKKSWEARKKKLLGNND